MIRLSQRAWNNVLIFSMLFMILIFNTSNNFLLDGEDDPWSPLLPENAVIMSIDYGSTKLERIGQGWRLNPPQAMAEATLQQLVGNWQSRQMQPTENKQLLQPTVVVVWLAGKAEGNVYQFEQVENQLLVNIDQQTYQIANTQLSDLLISGI